MSTRMLIDARHREETRVAVVKGNRIEEFDFESAQRAQIKGNIYLAKVTRVEPSLQAAFIEYGGNRHGFLAFSEIHPDYYQIPKADRDAILAEERAAAAEHAEELESERPAKSRSRKDDDYGDDEDHEDDDHEDDDHDTHGDDHVDNAANDALRKKRQNLRRRYKIQEVIKRRQVLLVQVVKEERGNKGAALTTYLSLAGRYSVLMPNTSHGGGISRKIASVADRKRLKSIVAEMQLPPSMGVIVRTAGASRTKPEIKRDFDYLSRLWDEIRQRTLASSAPALIHEDSDLIKRAIRDLYTREIDEVLVDGADGFKDARAYMKLLMPSHAKKVVQYSDPVPVYQRYRVEEQLAEMYQPTVRLKSGGYIVINPTEALVSIDINSGKSTREHNIEETAYKTNVEAAREIARQLKLRDMAGLVVIDFIDMDHHSHVRKVEKALKEALKDDRARIQVGRISQFGLMEMSRQRLRTGVLEASTHTCPVCDGAGIVRTVESAGLGAMREVESLALRGKNSHFSIHLPTEVAVYLVNEKRRSLANLEERYGITVLICPEDDMHINQREIDASGPAPRPTVDIERPEDVVSEPEDEELDIEDEDEDDAEDETSRGGNERDRNGGRGKRGRGRRRRGGRGRRDREERDEHEGQRDDESRRSQASDQDEPDEAGEESDRDNGSRASDDGEEQPRKRGRGRRGRRGGRGRRRNGDEDAGQADAAEAATEDAATKDADVEDAPADSGEADSKTDGESGPARKPRRRRARKSEGAESESVSAADAEPAATEEPAEEKPKKAAPRRRTKKAAEAGDEAAEQPVEDKPKRRSRKTAAKADPDADSAEAKRSNPDTADAPDAPDADSGETPAKPARKSRSRAKPKADKADKVEDAKPAKAPSAKDEDPAPQPAPKAAPEPPAEAASDTSDAANDANGGTKRKGWWQRTFGA